MLLYLDFETFSDRDIVKDSVYVYTESPRFEPLMMSYAIDDLPVKRVEDIGAMTPIITEALKRGAYFVAHNAQFERLVCSRLLWHGTGDYLSPERFIDTAALAAVQGYPRALGPLAKALGVTMKGSAGTRLISLFCKPNRDGTRTLPADKPEEWTRFGEYCDTDVYALRDAHRALMARYLHTRVDLAGWPTEIEQRVFIADQQINDRGIRVDTEMAREAVRAGADNALELEAEMYALTGLANPNSVAQMTGWLAEQGIEVPDLRAATVSDLLARDDIGDAVRRALVIRQELALAAAKKFGAAVRSTSGDGRARGLFQYCGAHTGRWAGRRIQLQNLPRMKHAPEREDALICDLLLGESVSNQDLKGLVRAMLLGPFTVVDYSAIEARVLAWLAGEQWVLDAFSAGRDIYVETAKRLGPAYSRQEGKVATLALGYQGAVGSLISMGAKGSEAELRKLVARWRMANPAITALWYELDMKFWTGGRVGEHLTIERDGRERRVILPSGRELIYHGVAKRQVVRDGFEREELSFLAPLPQRPRVPTYGGKLTENITQAVARDVLALALVRLSEVGLRVAGHVHDEVLIEGEHAVTEISALMCAPNGWSVGLPLDAAGYVTARYRKE